MNWIASYLKDPLTHFLLVGAVFFFAANNQRPVEPEPATDEIVVSRDALLDFIQFRSKAFQPDVASELLDSMDDARRQQLIDDFVEEEVLYREAKALGLDANDYVIKRRLVQNLEFLAQSSIGDAAPSDQEIDDYYDAHADDYYIQPSATFAHVFFSKDKYGEKNASDRAERLTTRLNRSKAPFEDAVKHGDRFAFHTNYVDRTLDYVVSHFGDDAAAAIFDEDGPFNAWRGPVASSYGAHVIVVAKVTPGRTPPLDEIAERVREDALRVKNQEALDAIIAETVARYDVVVDLPPKTETIAATETDAITQ